MTGFNAHRAGLSALAVLAMGLSACAVREGAPPAPDAPAAAEEMAKPACYPKFPAEDGELWYLDYVDETECYRLGVCEDARAENDGTGQCHKWALGADEPALAWSERLTNRELGNSIPPPEDLYEGFGELTSESCFENCQPVPIRLSNATILYGQPDTRSEVVDTLPATECVGQKSYRLLSSPTRGVVTETDHGYSAGDVIYSLAYEGEGTYLAWWRGGYTSAEYDYPEVQWEESTGPADPRAGYWLELVRADGTVGWALEPDYTDYGACAIPPG